MYIFASIAAAAALFWFLNRRKPVRHVLSELRYALDMQGVGAAGLVDDKLQSWRNKLQLPDASSRVAVITGGARGIGTEVIRQLLNANMTVVMGIRNPDLLTALAEGLGHSERLKAFRLDLKSLKSVKQFATEVLKQFPVIHILVNNAGIMYCDYELTEDGLETQLAVNYVGHFYLTHLLLPALRKGGSSGEIARVVNITSCAHYPGQIYFNDINMKEHYDAIAAYAQSKLAQLMSARHINTMLEEDGSLVRCYSVHPGIVQTGLFDNTFFKHLSWLTKLLFKTAAEGALPILYACFSKEVEKRGGLYISNSREGYSNRFSKSSEHQKRLHSLSCNLVGIPENSFGKTI